MACNDPNCEDGWVTYPPLQEGGMCAVRQCEDCAQQERAAVEERDKHAVHD
jgi:hypothetical protein